jgi:hypothetical protein
VQLGCLPQEKEGEEGEEEMTIEDIDQVLNEQAADIRKKRPQGGIIFRPIPNCSFVEVNPDLLLGAFAQVKRAVTLLQAGLADPKDHKAEALLLMLFNDHAEYGV